MKERYPLWFSITRWSARAVMWDQTTISPCTYLLPQKMVERPQRLRDKLHELSMTARIALSAFAPCRMKIILPGGMNTFATVTIGHTVNKKCCAYARILASRLFLKTANPMVTYGLHQAAVAGTARLPFSSAPAAAVYRRMQFGYRAICFCSNMQHRYSIIGKNYDT